MPVNEGPNVVELLPVTGEPSVEEVDDVDEETVPIPDWPEMLIEPSPPGGP